MTSDFCVEALEEAIARYGTPEIFNTDQGSQFTSADFTRVLTDNSIQISMDRKGRWVDNVFVERLLAQRQSTSTSICTRMRPSPRHASSWPLLRVLQRTAATFLARRPNA